MARLEELLARYPLRTRSLIFGVVHVNKSDIHVYSFASSCILSCQASETQGTMITCGVTRLIVMKRDKSTVSQLS